MWGSGEICQLDKCKKNMAIKKNYTQSEILPCSTEEAMYLVETDSNFFKSLT